MSSFIPQRHQRVDLSCAAGMKQASSATTIKPIDTATNVVASVGVTSNNKVLSHRVSAKAPANPDGDANQDELHSMFQDQLQYVCRSRTERHRIPISCVRWLTAYAITP